MPNKLDFSAINTLISIDRISDYVPVASTITNLVDIFEKFAFDGCCNSKSINSNHYFTYINEKSYLRCFVLLVPILGNIVVGIYDSIQNKVQIDLLDLKDSVVLNKINEVNSLVDTSNDNFKLNDNDIQYKVSPNLKPQVKAFNEEQIKDRISKIFHIPDRSATNTLDLNDNQLISNFHIEESGGVKNGKEDFKDESNLNKNIIDINLLPEEILMVSLDKVGSKDLVSSSIVSKKWSFTSLKVSKIQEKSLLESYGLFLSNCISEKYPDQATQIIELTRNFDFSSARVFSDIKNLLQERLSKIVEIISQIKNEDLKTLELLSAKVKKPTSFEVIFDLVEYLNEIHLLTSKRDFAGYQGDFHVLDPNSYSTKDAIFKTVENICALGSYDIAFSCIVSVEKKLLEYRLNPNNEYYRNAFCEIDLEHLYDSTLLSLIESTFQMGDFDKGFKLALSSNNIRTKIATVSELLLLGKIDKASALANTLPTEEQELILGVIPVVKLIIESNFSDAIEFAKKLDKDKSFKASRLIARAIDNDLELKCNRLIREGKFEKVNLLYVTIGENIIKENVLKNLTKKFISLERFDEAIECLNKLSLKDSETRLGFFQIIIELCEKGNYDEAFKIGEKSTFGDRMGWIMFDMALTVRSILTKKFDKEILHVKNYEDESYFKSEMFQYISRKLLKAGLVERAIEVAFMIPDRAIKRNTIKMFSES